MRFWHSPFRRLRIAPRGVRGILIGVLCALLVQGLFGLGWLRGLERGTLDTLFRLRGPHLGAPEIILVMADDATVARYKQWPLPRRAHADLVRKLKKAGAKTIAYDLLFPNESLSKADDEAFVQACREAGNVVHACAFRLTRDTSTPTPKSTFGVVGKGNTRFALTGTTEKNPASKIPAATWINAPFPGLMQSAAAVGHINIHPEKDGVLRRIPHALEYQGNLYPSLALATAAHYLNLKPAQVRIENSKFLLRSRQFGQRRLPMDAGGETWVNWAGGYRTYPVYSMLQVLSGEVPSAVFKDHIVLIGANAQSTFEWRATPFSPAQPAVELQANALDNILLQRPVTIASNSVRFMLALFLATFTGALIAPRLDLGATFLLLGICLLAWLVALVCFTHYSLYLPFAPAILSVALTYSLAMAINYREEWETNLRSGAAVTALARGGALMMSGRNRARLEAVIRSTASEALQADEVHLVFENHRSPDERVNEIVQAVRLHTRSIFHPESKRARSRSFLKGHAGPKGRMTWVAVPILTAAHQDADSGDDKNAARAHRKHQGVIIAIGQREGRAFTARDAAIMETLSEQAALALESLDYYELLQSRVDLANRDVREAYKVLTAQSARFMAAVESMDDAFLICDVEHRAVFVNGVANAVLFEATPRLGDCVPQTLREWGLPDLAALFDELDTAEESLHHEFPVGERTLAVQLTPLAEGGEENVRRTGAMLIVSDVTYQRELDRMKTDFVGFVAHELRSPLGIIMGYASLLQQNLAQSGSDPAAALQNEVLTAIDRQCRRLNRLVNDLLDIARLDAGHALDIRVADIELVALCERVIETQRAIVTNPKMKLSFECDLPAVPVCLDPDRVEQILVNLLSNAVKYSPDGGEIVVSLSDEDNVVQICVRDSGMGMTPEQTESLFQKFYRTPEAQVRGIKGTGLGLYLVKQLVEAHGGTISVESEQEKGTQFCVNFPRESRAQSPA